MVVWVIIISSVVIFFITTKMIEGDSNQKIFESDKTYCEKKVKVIAKLADEVCFSQYYNSAGSRYLSLHMGQVNEAAQGEINALQNERLKRSSDSYTTSERYTHEQTSDLLNCWLDSYVRPEFIQSRLACIFSNFNLNEKMMAKIMIPITKAVVEYDIQFSKYLNIRNDWGRKAQEIANEEMNNRKADGLSFGIISSDFKAHALYAVLNNAEIKKQLAEQDRIICGRMSATNKIAIERQYQQITSLYSQIFATKIKEAVKEAYIIIPSSKK